MFLCPDNAVVCSNYSVRVNGIAATVLPTGVASFASFETDGTAEIEITTPHEIQSVILRPLSLGLSARCSGKTVSFTLDRPCNIWVDIQSTPKIPPLYLFFYPPETNRPDPGDPNVIYFEAGRIHEPGLITLRDHQTLYIEGGAIVRGAVYACGAKGVTIRGRGVLDGSLHSPKLGQSCRSIFLDGCTDARIEDITMIHPSTWMVVLGACKNVSITNLHQIGEVVSSDGIDIVGSEDVTITGCFLRNNDDCVVVKSLDLSLGQPPAQFDARKDAQDVLVQNCTFWNDRAGNAMEIGFEFCTENIRRIVFRNIDVLAAHGEGAVFSIHNGDRAMVSDVLWEDIRVEHFYDKLIDFRIMPSRYSQDKTRGHIRDVTFRNIHTIKDIYNTPSLIGGYDNDHRIDNVRFENFLMGGEKITNADALHLFTKHADQISFS
jgi:hypothetical protein